MINFVINNSIEEYSRNVKAVFMKYFSAILSGNETYLKAVKNK